MRQITDVKLGWSQRNTPAPLSYRRFTNAMIICFLPVYTGFVDIIRMDDYSRTICTHIGVAIPIVLKGFGMFLGNGQQFFPSNEEMDSINSGNNGIKKLLFLCFIILSFIYFFT